MSKFFRARIPLFWMLVAVFITGLVTYYLIPSQGCEPAKKETNLNDCWSADKVKFFRNHEYRLIHRLLFTEISEEDPNLLPLKQKIQDFIGSEQKANNLISASVYFRKMNNSSWFAINPTEEYINASLFKVPVMLAILMQADNDPSFLNKKIYYQVYPKEVFNQNVPPLPGGKSYAVSTLLQSMISRSDNNAYDLLWKAMDKRLFDNVLKDLAIKPFNINDTNEYQLSVLNYSKMFRALYNGGLLSPELSELALEYLSESDFNDGITAGIDKSITVARKFGFRVTSTQAQLHEFGIFYIGEDPYLLGVMTKGYDYNKLSNVLKTISAMVYENAKRNV